MWTRKEFEKATWCGDEEVWAVLKEGGKVLRRRCGSTEEELRDDLWCGFLYLWSIFGMWVYVCSRGGVKVQERVEDLVDLRCELAGWRDDDCADMVLLERLVDV